jgi:hypothetical protein
MGEGEEEEEVQEDAGDSVRGSLFVHGYVRSRPLSANQLAHITGVGSFKIASISLAQDPCPLKPSRRPPAAKDAEGAGAGEAADWMCHRMEDGVMEDGVMEDGVMEDGVIQEGGSPHLTHTRHHTRETRQGPGLLRQAHSGDGGGEEGHVLSVWNASVAHPIESQPDSDDESTNQEEGEGWREGEGGGGVGKDRQSAHCRKDAIAGTKAGSDQDASDVKEDVDEASPKETYYQRKRDLLEDVDQPSRVGSAPISDSDASDVATGHRMEEEEEGAAEEGASKRAALRDESTHAIHGRPSAGLGVGGVSGGGGLGGRVSGGGVGGGVRTREALGFGGLGGGVVGGEFVYRDGVRLGSLPVLHSVGGGTGIYTHTHSLSGTHIHTHT